MPQYETHDAVRSHLKTALDQRTHFVFITDHPVGHLAISGLALTLTNALLPGDLGYGLFGFLVKSTGARTECSFLTVRKSTTSVPRVGAFLRELGMADPPRPEQDVIPLSDNPIHLAAVLDTVRRGAGHVLVDPQVN